MDGGLLLEQALIVVGILAASEIGFRIARRSARGIEPAHSTQATTVQAAVLGMLGLLLAFMLAMAESRFSGRRAMIVDEANAIGTTYLRAELLPDPHAAASRALLRRYVDERRAYHAVRADRAQIGASDARTAALQAELWQCAATAARAHPDSEVAALYVAALNEMFDLEAARAIAVAGRLPLSLIGLLFAVAMLANGITGYCCGLGRRRDALSLVVVPALIAAACIVVVDLDQPRAGLVRITDAAMERLQRAIAAEAVAGAAPGPR